MQVRKLLSTAQGNYNSKASNCEKKKIITIKHLVHMCESASAFLNSQHTHTKAAFYARGTPLRCGCEFYVSVCHSPAAYLFSSQQLSLLHRDSFCAAIRTFLPHNTHQATSASICHPCLSNALTLSGTFAYTY